MLRTVLRIQVKAETMDPFPNRQGGFATVQSRPDPCWLTRCAVQLETLQWLIHQTLSFPFPLYFSSRRWRRREGGR